MEYRIYLSIFAIILLAGCFPQTKDVEVLSVEDSNYELFLYTKQHQNEAANHYLSALLNWKTKQSSIETLDFKKSQTRSHQLRIPGDNLPALVIKKEGKILTSISGKRTSDYILTELENYISF